MPRRRPVAVPLADTFAGLFVDTRTSNGRGGASAETARLQGLSSADWERRRIPKDAA